MFDFLENLKLNSANKIHKYDSQGLLKYFSSHSAVFKHPISAILPNNLAINYIFALQVVHLSPCTIGSSECTIGSSDSEPSENITYIILVFIIFSVLKTEIGTTKYYIVFPMSFLRNRRHSRERCIEMCVI